VVIDLRTAARIVQEASRWEVMKSMEARIRFNPAWEVQEVRFHYAIRDMARELGGDEDAFKTKLVVIVRHKPKTEPTRPAKTRSK
jgi:hypothetical protein